MSEQKTENEVICLANLLAEHGYYIHAVKQQPCPGGEIVVRVSPPAPDKDSRK